MHRVLLLLRLRLLSLAFRFIFNVILLKVVVEVALGREASITAFRLALVRPFTCVQSQVSLEVSFLKECFPTVLDGAGVFSLALVLVQMDLEPLLAGIRFLAAFVVALVSADA